MAAEHGTWVFGPVIDMLETVGYVPGKSIRAFPYDWRCPPCKLQERDGYFTGAMEGIEELYAENQGCKVVIIGHSMGCKMTHYFCRWVATHPLGKARGGVQWLEKHIESMVALGGPFLGAPCSDRSTILGNKMGLDLFLNEQEALVMGRALGSAPWLLSYGRLLDSQPSASTLWLRPEGALKIHLISASIPEADDASDETIIRFTLHPPAGKGGRPITLSSKPVKGTNPYFDARFQFAVDDPNSLKGYSLEITKELDHSEFLTADTLRSVTFPLGEKKKGAISEGAPHFTALTAGEFTEYHKVDLGPAQLSLRLCWLPLGADDASGGFVHATKGGPGIGGAGDRAFDAPANPRRDAPAPPLPPDEGAKLPKLKEGVASAGGGEGSSRNWVPQTRETGAPFVARTLEQVLQLDGCRAEWKNWLEFYAGDEVYAGEDGQAAVQPPPGLSRMLNVYGHGIPTEMGACYRRATKVYDSAKLETDFELDTKAVVAHPDYNAQKGIVYSSTSTPQVDSMQAMPKDVKEAFSGNFSLQACGDKTCPYWSLRWPETWQGSDTGHSEPLEVESVAVPEAEHRAMLKHDHVHGLLVRHLCIPPLRVFTLSLVAAELPSIKGKFSGVQKAGEGYCIRMELDDGKGGLEPSRRQTLALQPGVDVNTVPSLDIGLTWAHAKADEHRDVTMTVSIIKRSLFCPGGRQLDAKRVFSEMEIFAPDEDGDGTADAAGKETFTLEFIDPTTKRAGSFTFLLRQHDNSKDKKVQELKNKARFRKFSKDALG